MMSMRTRLSRLDCSHESRQESAHLGLSLRQLQYGFDFVWRFADQWDTQKYVVEKSIADSGQHLPERSKHVIAAMRCMR